MKHFRYFAFVLFLVFCPSVFALSDAEMESLKAKVINMEKTPTLLARQIRTAPPACYPVDEAPPVSKEDLVRLNRLIQPDGTFKDVDYKDKNRSAWLTMKHLDYCRMLAIALHTYPADLLKASNVKENCLKSLDWWLENKPRNPNWWCNDVYVPQMLGNIAILLGDDLTEDRKKTIGDMTRSIKPRMTGQNLMWLSWNTMLLGLVANDSPRVEQALDSLNSTISISPPGKEGIQIDMSFQQHGPQLYQGNYGRHYLHSASKYVNAARGTRWENPEKTAILERYLLDGTRWMCWGGLLDYSAWGRQISYNDRFQGPDIVYAASHLLPCADERKDDISSFSSSLLGERVPNRLAGTRAFPVSDYIVHRTPDFMTTVRMSSKRTVIGENTNGDNLKGSYLSDGAMLTYKTGREYDSVFPCWDWSCIPGTTARRGYIPPKWASTRGSSPFAGSMNEGVAAMTVDHFGLKANKSWFFFNDRIVCLGSGITPAGKPTGTGKIVTTIEQSILASKKPVQSKGRDATGILHDGTLYLVGSGNDIILETAQRKGSWKDIRSSSPDKELERPVFLLMIDHGAKPENGSYAYQVFPKKPAVSSVDSLWNETHFLRHDDKVHAVQHGNTVKAVFFSPDALTLPDGTVIKPEEPCLLTVSPEGSVSVQVPGKVDGTTVISTNGKPSELPLERAAR